MSETDSIHKHTPGEWIARSMTDVKYAEKSFKARKTAEGIQACKRAAGMAINAILLCHPEHSLGNTIADRLHTLSHDPSVPAAVRDACSLLVNAALPGGDLLLLARPNKEQALLEAAKDVMAHAYAILLRSQHKGASA